MEHNLVPTAHPSVCYRIHDPYLLQDKVSLVQSEDKERKKACVTSAGVHLCGEACVRTHICNRSCVFAVIQPLRVLYLQLCNISSLSPQPPKHTHSHTHTHSLLHMTSMPDFSRPRSKTVAAKRVRKYLRADRKYPPKSLSCLINPLQKPNV